MNNLLVYQNHPTSLELITSLKALEDNQNICMKSHTCQQWPHDNLPPPTHPHTQASCPPTPHTHTQASYPPTPHQSHHHSLLQPTSEQVYQTTPSCHRRPRTTHSTPSRHHRPITMKSTSPLVVVLVYQTIHRLHPHTPRHQLDHFPHTSTLVGSHPSHPHTSTLVGSHPSHPHTSHTRLSTLYHVIPSAHPLLSLVSLTTEPSRQKWTGVWSICPGERALLRRSKTTPHLLCRLI